jgi:hypothetical protein
MRSKIRFALLALPALAWLSTQTSRAQFTWDGGGSPDGN